MLKAQKKRNAKVIFAPLSDRDRREKLFSSAENVLNHRAFHLLRVFSANENVGVKISRDTASMTVDLVCAIAGMLRSRGSVPFICDTSIRHFEPKANAVEHMNSMASHFESKDLESFPLVMLDGMNGEHEISRQDCHEMKPNVYLSGELPFVKGMVLVSQLHSDPLCGMSGALFGLGNGLASKRGKIGQYAMSIPGVNIEKCHTCRKCLRACPTNAIRMGDNHVEIDSGRCINCGQCVEVAKFGGVTYKWDATPDHFQERMISHAASTIDVVGKRIVYVSRVSSVEDDECIGLLFSRDPVAIDAAGLKMACESGVLTEDNTRIAESMLSLAEEAGIGTSSHELETVAY